MKNKLRRWLLALGILTGVSVVAPAETTAAPVAVEINAPRPEGLTNCVAGGRTTTQYVEANGYCRDNCSYCSNKRVSMTYYVPKLGRNVTTAGNCVDGVYESSVVRVYNSVMSGSQRFVSASMVGC